MTTTNVGLDTSDQERFLEGLRALLGKGGKLKRALFGTLAEDIEKIYRHIEALLREIRMYRGVTAAEADEQRLLNLRQMVAASTTEKEFKQSKKQLEELEKRLEGECSGQKKQAEGVPWGKSRIAAHQAIEQAAATWASPSQLVAFRAYLARLTSDGEALATDRTKAQGPAGTALAGRFDQLVARIGQARTDVTGAVKLWKDARDAVSKELAALGGLASATTRASFESRLAVLAADANERHLFAESASKGTALATEIAARLVVLRQEKADCQTQLPLVRQALADGRPKLAELAHGLLHERLVAAAQQANEGNYEDAAPALRTLLADVRTAVGKAMADQQRYDTHAGRKSIPADLLRLRTAHPKGAMTLLSGIGGELTTVQHVADTTRDYARAVQQLDDLVQRVATAATKLATSEGAFADYEVRKAKYDASWRAAKGELQAIAKNLGHLQPTVLESRLLALENLPLPTGEPKTDQSRIADYETRLAAWVVDAKAVADPKSPAFQALQQSEFSRHEVQAQRKLYMAWRQRFTEAVTRLQSFGGAAAEQAKTRFQELEAKAASDDVAEVKAAVIGLNQLFDTVTKAWDGGVAKAKELQTTLRARQNTFDTRFQELGKRLQAIRSKDAAYDYRQALQQQVTEVMQAVLSQHQGVLQDAIAKMDQLIASLERTADDQGRQPILQIEAAKKAITTALDDATFKKQMPQTRARLAAAKDQLFEGAGGTTPLDRALTALEEFRDDLQDKVAAAARIADHKVALRAVRDEFESSFEQLGAKIRDFKKQAPYAGLEIPGTAFGALGEAYKAWQLLGTGEDERLYQDARAQVTSLRQQLAEALRDPFPAFAGEQKLLEERAKKAAALDQDKQRFQLELQRYHNVDRKRAKEAVDRGGDQQRFELLAQMEKQLEAFVKQGDMDNARAKLGSMSLLAQRLAIDPVTGGTSPNLGSLGQRWRQAVGRCGEALTAVSRRIAEECQKANDTPEGVATLRRELPRATEGLAPDAFDAPIAVLMDSRSQAAARQRAREQGLAKVLEFLRHVENDPLLKMLASNPFGVSFPAGALYKSLSDLRLNLEISAST